MADKKRGGILQFLLIFLALYIGMQLLFGMLFPKNDAQQQAVAGPTLTAATSFTLGNHPVAQLFNRPAATESHGAPGWLQAKWCGFQRVFTGSPSPQDCAKKAAIHTGPPYALPVRCPKPLLDLFIIEGETQTLVTSEETVIPCEPIAALEAGETVQISLGPWKYSLFEKLGTYEARLPGSSATAQKTTSGTVMIPQTSVRFSIVEPGFFTKIFRTFITAPFLNFLVLIASLSPGYSLAIAIILLTLAVKLLLFFPTQHALEGQKKMQMLQPKIEALKRQYPDDPKKVQEETMKLWKEHKINPMQSCLPMLIQFPILIGLFYVIRDGSDISLSRHLLYGPFQNLSWDFGTNFLGLDLLKPEVFVMPILLVALQYFQMKLTFSIQKRKKAKEGGAEKGSASPQDMQQNIMLYGLPLMIGFFAIQFPAAVSLYWGVSTLFAIGQQIIVNREHLRV